MMLFRRRNALWGLTALLTVLPGLAVGRPAQASVETMPCHGTATAYRLLVTTRGVRSNHGYLVANLYGSDKQRWLADDGWLNVWRDPALPGDETMCLYLPGPGSYALVMFHDANADGVLNLGPFGPKEGYGFSNNLRPMFSAPSLSAALFPVAAGDARITIRLRYPPIS
jgi:uncharacterized protein (DUF2141 family)